MNDSGKCRATRFQLFTVQLFLTENQFPIYAHDGIVLHKVFCNDIRNVLTLLSFKMQRISYLYMFLDKKIFTAIPIFDLFRHNAQQTNQHTP